MIMLVVSCDKHDCWWRVSELNIIVGTRVLYGKRESRLIWEWILTRSFKMQSSTKDNTGVTWAMDGSCVIPFESFSATKSILPTRIKMMNPRKKCNGEEEEEKKEEAAAAAGVAHRELKERNSDCR